MIERLLITLVIGLVALGAYHLLLWYQRRRVNLATANTTPTTELASARLLYFRSAHCGSCSAQARYLVELDERHQALIEPIDVDRSPELARQYKVMTLPTIILLDSQGQVRHINPGLTNPFKLSRQLEALIAIRA